MGCNRIGDIMKRIVAGTSFEKSKRLTNHSGRKTLVKKLDNANVPRDKIIAVTGHRNEKYLDDYVDAMNYRQSRQLSDIISGDSTGHNTANQVSLPSPSQMIPANPPKPADQMYSSYPVINLTGISANSTVNITFNNSCNTATAAATASSSFSKQRFGPYKRIRQMIDSDEESD